jgi:hypothetical protein
LAAVVDAACVCAAASIEITQALAHSAPMSVSLRMPCFMIFSCVVGDAFSELCQGRRNAHATFSSGAIAERAPDDRTQIGHSPCGTEVAGFFVASLRAHHARALL